MYVDDGLLEHNDHKLTDELLVHQKENFELKQWTTDRKAPWISNKFNKLDSNAVLTSTETT